MRSLIELPGLKIWSLASTVASVTPRVSALMRTIGVFPMASRIVLQTLVPEACPTLLIVAGRQRGSASADECSAPIILGVERSRVGILSAPRANTPPRPATGADADGAAGS